MRIALTACRELGLGAVSLYAGYQLGLRSGFFALATQDRSQKNVPANQALRFSPCLELPEADQVARLIGEGGVTRLMDEANEIVAGKVRLFGGEPVNLELIPPGHLVHWTVYEKRHLKLEDGGDIKFVWEPGRFGWAIHLGRAYYLTGDERYADAFWQYTDTFLQANPPYRGLHWTSAQEVAIRLICFTFALSVFSPSGSTTPDRRNRLAQAIADHAARIPPTISYARAQNNNHLLSEAAALYTAAAVLPDHPQAKRWGALGWRWFNQGILDQVASDGAYIQNSTNYHRMMLQIALWFERVAAQQGQPLPQATRGKLAAATRWLLALVDVSTGRVPNLGPNDGALILPLTTCSFDDYRPTLQAAACVFLDTQPFIQGAWDEMWYWLLAGRLSDQPATYDPQTERSSLSPLISTQPSPHVLCAVDGNRGREEHSRAYLRVANLVGRPGHADQLHLDLWWRGLNIARDAGTYLYNAAPPWDNALACTGVHNTVTVNGLDQMERAGRFLYVNRARARLLSRDRARDGSAEWLLAEHDGYRRLGVIHQRNVESYTGGWRVTDWLLPVSGRNPSRVLYGHCPSISPSNPPLFKCNLHWLLPDWEWELEDEKDADRRCDLRLRSPWGWISLLVRVDNPSSSFTVRLARAGECLYGAGSVPPIFGWMSPTYGVKEPALSLQVGVNQTLPVIFHSDWNLP